MKKNGLFVGLAKDGQKIGDYAITDNAQIIAERLGLKSPCETGVLRLTVQGRKSFPYDIGEGKYGAAIVMEAMLMEKGIVRSGKVGIQVDAKFLGKLKLAMGEQIWGLAGGNLWSAEEHFMAAIRQAIGPTTVWIEFKD